MTARLLPTALLVLLGMLPACTSSHHVDRAQIAQATQDWPYAPVAIRVHPISRIKIDRDTSQAMVHARIELLDVDGFSTRGPGDLTLILSGQSEDGVMLMSQTEWHCDLTDPVNNRQYYDEVTRTYQAVLELSPNLSIPWEPSLRAVLKLPDGQSLSDSRRVRFTREPRDEDSRELDAESAQP